MISVPRNWPLLTLVFICCLCLFVAGTVGASGEYELHSDNAVDTPERTVTFEGNELTITHTGVFEYGTPITATVSAPNESHSVQLRSATDPGQIIDNRADGPQGTVSFSTVDNQLDPGTYVLLLSDSVFQRGVPVVVSGYDISAELSEDETADELEITTTVSPTESSGQPAAVEAVVWNADTQKRVTLTQQSGDQYGTTVSVSEFESSYEVYVSAIGDETMYNSDGENEILGIGQATFDDTGSTDDGGSQPTTGGGGQPTDGDETTDNSSTDPTNNSSVDGNETDPVDNSTDDATDSPADDDADSSADDSSVIEPTDDSVDAVDETGAEDGQTAADTPLSPAVAVVALLSCALIAARRAQ